MKGLKELKEFDTEENHPGVYPIVIFYFLIVIGYYPMFTSEENHLWCRFVNCSLFFVLYSIFIFKFGPLPHRGVSLKLY